MINVTSRRARDGELVVTHITSPLPRIRCHGMTVLAPGKSLERVWYGCCETYGQSEELPPLASGMITLLCTDWR